VDVKINELRQRERQAKWRKDRRIVSGTREEPGDGGHVKNGAQAVVSLRP